MVFSADPIPGNEISIYEFIDTLTKGAKVLYSEIAKDFHVSGHGAALDIMLMMSLVKPLNVVANRAEHYKQMVAFKNLAKLQGFSDKQIIFAENGQEVIFDQGRATVWTKSSLLKTYMWMKFPGKNLISLSYGTAKKLLRTGS